MRNELHTPSLDLGILAGRDARSCFSSGCPCSATRCTRAAYEIDEAAAAEEAFTSSSVREVMPAVELDGRPIGDGKPGPAARALQEELRRCASSS